MNRPLSERSNELDIIKGCLVFLMILYHCASVSDFPELAAARHRIRFIHSAFLIISGFLCGIHYYPKTLHGDQLGAVRNRLVSRGAKLIAIFLLSNVLFHVLGLAEGSTPVRELFGSWQLVLDRVILSADGPLLAFEILWYIGVFLVLAGTLMSLPYVPFFCLLLLFLPQLVPGQSIVFIAHGALGMLAGILARNGHMDRIHTACHRFGAVFIAAVIAMLIMSTPTGYPGGRVVTVLFRSLETATWFYALSTIFSRHSAAKGIQESVARIGRYTLIAYLFQMPCARIVHHASTALGLRQGSYYMLAIAIVSASTLLVVRLSENIRRRSTCADAVYRFWFC